MQKRAVEVQTILWEHRFSELLSSSDDGVSRLRLHFSLPIPIEQFVPPETTQRPPTPTGIECADANEKETFKFSEKEKISGHSNGESAAMTNGRESETESTTATEHEATTTCNGAATGTMSSGVSRQSSREREPTPRPNSRSASESESGSGSRSPSPATAPRSVQSTPTRRLVGAGRGHTLSPTFQRQEQRPREQSLTASSFKSLLRRRLERPNAAAVTASSTFLRDEKLRLSIAKPETGPEASAIRSARSAMTVHLQSSTRSTSSTGPVVSSAASNPYRSSGSSQPTSQSPIMQQRQITESLLPEKEQSLSNTKPALSVSPEKRAKTLVPPALIRSEGDKEASLVRMETQVRVSALILHYTCSTSISSVDTHQNPSLFECVDSPLILRTMYLKQKWPNK